MKKIMKGWKESENEKRMKIMIGRENDDGKQIGSENNDGNEWEVKMIMETR